MRNFCEGGTSILLPCNFYNRFVSPMQCTLIHKVSFIKVAPNVANHLSFTVEVFVHMNELVLKVYFCLLIVLPLLCLINQIGFTIIGDFS